MDKSLARKKWLPVLLHILAWFVLLILPQIIINRYSSRSFIPWDFYMWAAGYGAIFYINYLWLVPGFYFKEKKTAYFIVAIIVIIALYIALFYTNQLIHNPDRDRAFQEGVQNLSQQRPTRSLPPPRFLFLQTYQYGIISTIVTIFSLGLRVIQRHSAIEKRQKELEKEKLHSELAFLKNQVSPHFFFNTLNNIYSLIEINSDNAQEAVLKLSKLMRYLLYESEHGKTSLSNEIDFMNHYIDLMKLRLSNKVELKIEMPEKDTDATIPPLLFIPFIENAFKHGISYREKSFIHISMQTTDNKILFNCNNSIGQKNENIHIENHSGIGLENVKKRLNLLFYNSHKLKIDISQIEFRINLEIELK